MPKQKSTGRETYRAAVRLPRVVATERPCRQCGTLTPLATLGLCAACASAEYARLFGED